MAFCRLLLLCLVIGLGQCQRHEGPGINCYNCGGGHHDHHFPACLSEVHQCHHEEICQINYSGTNVEMRCHRSHDCEHQVNEASKTCSTGDALVHDECQRCCSDTACVDEVVQRLTTQGAVDHTAVHCPGMCHMDNLAACVTNGGVCNSDQYCKVSLDELTKEMHGQCEDKVHIQWCRDEVADGHCGHNRCTTGCCTDDSCVVTSIGGQSTSWYELLKGDCVDQIPSNQCATLDTSEHLCSDRLALRLCPRSCGLCSVFNVNDCADTVISAGGCPALVVSEDICNNSVAKYVCPVTCNMCDAILDELIKEALANARPTSSPVVTTMAPDTTADVDVVPTDAVVATTTFISCTDLATQGCDVMNVLCPTMDCPTQCAMCRTTPVPVDITSTPATTTTTSEPDVFTDEPTVPDIVESQPTRPPTTTAVAVEATSTGAPTPEPTASTIMLVSPTGPVCEDSLTGVGCADLNEPCQSPLLVNFCQKFCQLC